MISRPSIPLLLTLGAFTLLAGCTEMKALQARTEDQNKLITRLQQENTQFQDAYYQIKETMDAELAKSNQRIDQLERELDAAKNLKSQNEKELSDQLRTKTLELDAVRREMTDAQALQEAQLTQLQRTNESLAAERDAALDKLNKSEAQLRTEREQSKQLTQQVANLTVDLKAAADQVSSLQAERNAAVEAADKEQKARQAAEAQATTLTETLAGAQAELTQLKPQVAEKDKTIEALQAKQTELEAQVAARGEQDAAAQKAIEEKAALEQQVAELKQKAAAQESAPAKALSLADDPALQKAAQALEAKIKEAGADNPAGKLKVMLDGKGLRILLPSDLLFNQNSVVLSDQAAAILAPAIETAAQLSGRAIKIEGHTDNEPIKDLPFADNWGLGFARADRVRNFLMTQGKIDADRLTALTRSSYEPLTGNDSPEGRARNRRVELVIGAAQ